MEAVIFDGPLGKLPLGTGTGASNLALGCRKKKGESQLKGETYHSPLSKCKTELKRAGLGHT